MEALKEIVSTVDGLQDDVAHLLPSLVQFGFTKEASAVQGSFGRLSGRVRENMATIWPSGGGSVAVGPADIQVCMGCYMLGTCTCTCSNMWCIHALINFAEESWTRCHSQQYHSSHDCSKAITCHECWRYGIQLVCLYRLYCCVMFSGPAPELRNTVNWKLEMLAT